VRGRVATASAAYLSIFERSKLVRRPLSLWPGPGAMKNAGVEGGRAKQYLYLSEFLLNQPHKRGGGDLIARLAKKQERSS